MKKQLISLLILILSTSIHAKGIPLEISDDLLKSETIELLKDNIDEFYRITDFYAGRTTEDNGDEIAMAIVQFKNAQNVCKEIAAVARLATCLTVATCDIEGYLFDCGKSLQAAIKIK